MNINDALNPTVESLQRENNLLHERILGLTKSLSAVSNDKVKLGAQLENLQKKELSSDVLRNKYDKIQETVIGLKNRNKDLKNDILGNKLMISHLKSKQEAIQELLNEH